LNLDLTIFKCTFENLHVKSFVRCAVLQEMEFVAAMQWRFLPRARSALVPPAVRPFKGAFYSR
jgi:hypothetical protein